MKKRAFIILFAVVLSLVLGAATLFAAPGGSDDPVITLSYVEQVLIPHLQQMFQGKTGQTFVVVEIPKGKRLIADGGTELILRQGNATAIAAERGGLSDVTHGTDLGDKQAIPANAHLIVPRTDGRGVTAQTENVTFLIKGNYKLED